EGTVVLMEAVLPMAKVKGQAAQSITTARMTTTVIMGVTAVVLQHRARVLARPPLIHTRARVPSRPVEAISLTRVMALLLLSLALARSLWDV
ncbi:Sister chromatid cohesion protein 2, partial [Ascosphaera pollenicola]